MQAMWGEQGGRTNMIRPTLIEGEALTVTCMDPESVTASGPAVTVPTVLRAARSSRLGPLEDRPRPTLTTTTADGDSAEVKSALTDDGTLCLRINQLGVAKDQMGTSSAMECGNVNRDASTL